MEFAVQIFSALSGMRGNVFEKLRAMAAAGITEVEPCVSADPIPGAEEIVWTLDWMAEHAEEIKACGVGIPSAHVFGEVAGQAERLKAAARAVGLKAYVMKTPTDINALSLQQASLTYRKLAGDLEEEGVELWLHNEAGDIATKVQGKSAYERLLDLCGGKVSAQVDVGWVLYAGEDPLTLLERNADRVRAVHYKDFAAGSKEAVDVALGTGALDVKGCFRFARSRNLPQYVDQEHFGTDVPGELAAAVRKLNDCSDDRENTVSYLNTYDIETGGIRVLARFEKVIEAPNWLKKSDTILFNAGGRMYAYDLASGTETLLDTGACDQCNNDHVVSPDEEEIAVSHMTFDDTGFSSRVYVVPLAGGTPRLVTPNSPSFLHGWSPDGAEMAYCAFRNVNGVRTVNVYTIPAAGGEERCLTDGDFNDGPEYSPDGEWIWYNSTKSGLMQIWKMRRDGSGQTQVTRNTRNNWFAHVSPDGKKVAYLSYAKRQLEPSEHLPNMPVELWLMNADGSDQHRILSLFGGQGSMNVNSWAGDSRRFAFVSYETVCFDADMCHCVRGVSRERDRKEYRR